MCVGIFLMSEWCVRPSLLETVRGRWPWVITTLRTSHGEQARSNLLDDLCTGSCLKFLPDFPGVVGWKESVFSQVALGHGVYRSRKVNTDPTVVVSIWNLAVSIARWLVGTENPPNLAEHLVWHTQCWITGQWEMISDFHICVMTHTWTHLHTYTQKAKGR